jgi:hypothetical protein
VLFSLEDLSSNRILDTSYISHLSPKKSKNRMMLKINKINSLLFKKRTLIMMKMVIKMMMIFKIMMRTIFTELMTMGMKMMQKMKITLIMIRDQILVKKVKMAKESTLYFQLNHSLKTLFLSSQTLNFWVSMETKTS